MCSSASPSPGFASTAAPTSRIETRQSRFERLLFRCVLGLDAEGLGDLVHFVEMVATLVAVCLDDRPALDFVGVGQALSGAPLDHQGGPCGSGCPLRPSK
jgi:hypothetical protein